jgi:hypothetical protein
MKKQAFSLSLLFVSSTMLFACASKGVSSTVISAEGTSSFSSSSSITTSSVAPNYQKEGLSSGAMSLQQCSDYKAWRPMASKGTAKLLVVPVVMGGEKEFTSEELARIQSVFFDDSRIVLSAMNGGARNNLNRGAVPYSVFISPAFSRVGSKTRESLEPRLYSEVDGP